MGLASALTTALTGMTAAETQIDVVGNNLANSQTIGFKESQAFFATQFLQTLGLGSAPTDSTGGVNPRQTGLGTQVAEITPNFTQGTIEISSNPSDLAIQGDGFFIVQGTAGEQLFSRNGVFKTNAENELVTINGNRLLGFGVDERFAIQTTELVPLNIPLGSSAVAQATQNVYLEGTLTPTGDIADTAEVIESAVLGDAKVPRPDLTGASIGVATRPVSTAIGVAQVEGTGGTHNDNDVFQYRFTYVDDSGTESAGSDAISVTVTDGDAIANNSTIRLTLPTEAAYSTINIYRTTAGGSTFYRLAQGVAMGSVYDDDNNTALSANTLDTTSLNANYTYLLTYHKSGEVESRPSLELGPQNVVNGRIQIRNVPTAPPPGVGVPDYDQIRIYRNTVASTNSYYLVATVDEGQSYTDSRTDAEITNALDPNYQTLDMDGPKISYNTLLTDVIHRDSLDFENLFSVGTLRFSGRKGGRSLDAQELEITATSTVQDLIGLMEQSMGIQEAADDPQNPIPGSVNNIPGETGTLAAGASVTQAGELRFVSNNGVDNALSIPLAAFQLDPGDGTTLNPNLGFGSIQTAAGQSAFTDFVAYDSLGVPLNVRVTAVLQARSGSATTYRWFADTADNDPLSGVESAVGTGLISFDGEGNVTSVSDSRVSIERRHTPATSPLEFGLDFSQISGLAAETASIAASRQDGSSTGTLTSFIIGEDGIVRGVFSNGVSRDLGQVRLARFGNPTGLEQRGLNLFATGVNSGLPVEGNPGAQGIGTLIAGAVELSNTDIGQNLIDLVLATTQYRGNTRVISTSQQLLEELLNLRR